MYDSLTPSDPLHAPATDFAVRFAADAPGVSSSMAEVRRTLDRVVAALAEPHGQPMRSGGLQARAPQPVIRPQRVRRDVDTLRAELRESVVVLARRLRAEHVPPERMLVLVKGAVHDTLPPLDDLLVRRDLMESVVRWSIDAYYAA